uniref:Myogenesis-regulating glycosidase n=1 Tax=Trichogramma kaykai TaxID=54128 RepID=A0ABD2WU37_9HYME
MEQRLHGVRKQKKHSGRKKKVLLSIVDPWDDRIASVDPLDLAARRGEEAAAAAAAVVVDATAAAEVAAATSSSSSSNRACRDTPPTRTTTTPDQQQRRIRTPWPWYKPRYSELQTAPTTTTTTTATPTADVSIKLDDDDEQRQEKQKQRHSDDDRRQRLIEQTYVFPKEDDNDDEDAAAAAAAAKAEDPKAIVERLVNARYNRPPVIQRKFQRPIVRTTRQQPHRTISGDGVEVGVEDKHDDGVIDTVAVRAGTETTTTTTTMAATIVDVDAAVKQQQQQRRGGRKLSSSMPGKLDDMDDLRIGNDKGVSSKFARQESDSSVTFSNSGSTFNGSTLGSDTEDDLNEHDAAKIPLQSQRQPIGVIVPQNHHNHQSSRSKKLINNNNSANNNNNNNNNSNNHSNGNNNNNNGSGGDQLGGSGDYSQTHPSANSTITSVNSISSLLKEKLQWTIPQALRNSAKRQNADYRLKTFVGFLFLCIVFLVGFAHIYYTQHVLQRAYFDKFRFNKNERQMHVYNSAGGEIVSARLGVGIPGDVGVFPCLPEHELADKVCLEWRGHSRLYLSHRRRDPATDCYEVTWQALRPGVWPRDCFDWSAKRGGHWYGAGQLRDMAYPLEQQSRLESAAFITGDVRKGQPFGNVLRRYFLSSRGATITVDPDTPLYVSILPAVDLQVIPGTGSSSSNSNKELCLEARHDGFAFVAQPGELARLNYSVCASNDSAKKLHATLAEKYLWDGLRPEELQAVQALLSEPVWQIAPGAGEADVANYTEDVIALGFLRQGHVLLSEQWQPSSGDLALDEARFHSMRHTIDVMHRRGFRIVFTLQPFVSTESSSFRQAVAEGLLVGERGSDPRIPALTRYRDVSSAGVLDITNNRTLPWLQAKLEALVRKYEVDAFYLDLGTAHDMPHYFQCSRPLASPDHYKSLFVDALLASPLPVIGVSSAVQRPRGPVFVSLPPFASSWKAIKTVIPTVLSYGIIGFPFVMPGAVGGDVALPTSSDNNNNNSVGGGDDDDDDDDDEVELQLPDKELYVRWLQLATFLPVIRFSHLPSKYADESVLEIAKNLTSLRQKTVTPLLKKYANVTLDTGLPIIRPLWMLDPADPACHLVLDEFSVGEELIVAPILHSGSRQREVYLPAGVWKDGIDKSLRKGSRWIHNYRVAEDKVAYFVKMPDDMRF